jgi:hypothetical protein
MSGSSRLVPVAVAFAVAAVASVAVVPPPTAHAKPAYSQKEGKPCGFCHQNPRGGGARNEKGSEYERNGFKFPTTAAGKGFGEDEAFKSQGNADRFEFARAALQNEHYADAFRRIAELKLREDKKGAGYQKIVNLEAIVEGKGRDLVRAAKEAIQGGKAADAADALARVELEFKGRDAAKEVPARRADLLKLPGGKEADAKARIDAPQRVRFLDARMKEVEGDVAAAQKILLDMLAKWPEGRFATDVKTKLDEFKAAAAAPAMGG